MALFPAPPTNISPNASGIIVPAATRALAAGVKVAVDEDTNQKTEVGKTGDDKCFFAGCDGFFLGIIETDEQVRADAHQFPKDVHLENIGCYYQSQH